MHLIRPYRDDCAVIAAGGSPATYSNPQAPRVSSNSALAARAGLVQPNCTIPKSYAVIKPSVSMRGHHDPEAIVKSVITAPFSMIAADSARLAALDALAAGLLFGFRRLFAG